MATKDVLPKIDSKLRGVQQLQAEVRVALETVTFLEDKVAEDPADLDETELRERKEAEQQLPIAQLRHEAAKLRLQIGDDPPSKELEQAWREQLEKVEKKVELLQLRAVPNPGPDDERRMKQLNEDIEKVEA